MWACGSDDDVAIPPGGAGSGGASAGSGGHSAGSAGAHAGGAGKAQGGGSNGGSDNGGGSNGGNGGSAGIGVAGAAGATEMAGAGGDSAGGSGGDSTGAGGEGGAPSPPTVAESCATICAAESGLSCALASGTCITQCTGLATDSLAPDDYPAMVACQALHLTATNYECSDQNAGSPPLNIQPSPKAGTACEAQICKWTCADGLFIDANAYARCGC